MNKKKDSVYKTKLISMFKFLVIILLVWVIFHLNNERVFVDGADKSSEDSNVLRGAHFKVLAFHVNIKYSYNN